MLNKEYYAKEIVEIVTREDDCRFSVNKHTGELCKCKEVLLCDRCLFYDTLHSCNETRNKWANREHIELTEKQNNLILFLKNRGIEKLAILNNEIIVHEDNLGLIEQYLGIKIVGVDHEPNVNIEDIFIKS